MNEQITQIRLDNLAKISAAKTLAELDQIYLSLFGKNGVITMLPKEFPKMEKQVLAVVVPAFNQLKNDLSLAVDTKRNAVREEGYALLANENVDLNAPVTMTERIGHLHPITEFEREVAAIFKKIGFSQYDAPQIDTDFYNFEVLNIPDEHPARDLWDTLYIDKSKLADQKQTYLLRTHTSNTQVRTMKHHKPPIRMMILGRCFRYENLDARHEHTFQQFELVYIDKNVSMANLQYLSEVFLQQIFSKDMTVRLRPKFYPFTEPGVGVDGMCFCKGAGCKICGGSGWLELAGAGMIHPTVLKNGGIDPNEYSGIAWGFGTFRVAMLKYGVEDMRIFNSGDLRYLKKEKGEQQSS